ncbi:hypothetical protein SAMN05421743_101295 [Thalassobacillus cyri]|uniref:Uncharacterized protein n=1 Tax=Thalassobacillus cyri TaxID=571932 RepID=A0A1H3W4X4_9BACI|nr:hypothetical protein SAMN05421743_101295 [Thalassobacillus cyri]
MKVLSLYSDLIETSTPGEGINAFLQDLDTYLFQ